MTFFLSTAKQGKNVWFAVSCNAVHIIWVGDRRDYIERFSNECVVHLELYESQIFHYKGPFNKPAVEIFHWLLSDRNIFFKWVCQFNLLIHKKLQRIMYFPFLVHWKKNVLPKRYWQKFFFQTYFILHQIVTITTNNIKTTVIIPKIYIFPNIQI